MVRSGFKNIFFLTCVFSLTSSAALADESVILEDTASGNSGFSLSIGTEIMSGHTTQSLNGPGVDPDGTVYPYNSPFSKLEYPLDIVLFRIDGSVKLNEKWKFNAVFKTDVSGPDDNMEDSDWLTLSNPGQIDVFSESLVSKFDAAVFDANVEWTFIRERAYSVYAGVGYQYQKFSYTTNGLYQVSPSGEYSLWDIYLGGRTPSILYDVTYHMPYLLVGSEIKVTDQLTLSGFVTFSPYVTAEDEDRHLLRENGGHVKIGDMDGTAFTLDVSGQYNFTHGLWLQAGIHLTRITVDGTMDQSYVNTGYFGSNGVESESSQTSGYLKIGLDF